MTACCGSTFGLEVSYITRPLWLMMQESGIILNVKLFVSVRCYTGAVITFPARAVAKYCDGHVPVCLSVLEHISRTTRAIFTNFSVHVAYGRGSVLLRQGDEIPSGKGNFGGCLGHSKALTIFAAAVAAAYTAEGIIQSSIASCSRKDH